MGTLFQSSFHSFALFPMNLNQYLDRFNGLDYAFAYGSGVFRQTGYTDEEIRKSMVDFIISTEDVNHWHEINKSENPQDYSILKRASGNQLAKITVLCLVFLEVRREPVPKFISTQQYFLCSIRCYN